MSARRAASVVLAAAVLLSTAGCSFFADQTTTKPYDPSDGVGATIGNLKVANAILLSSDGERASLLVNFINQGNKKITVHLQYQTEDTHGTKSPVDETVSVPANSVKSLGADGDKDLVFTGIDSDPGTLFPVFFQYGGATGKELMVPVLNGKLSQYTNLLPGTPTPTPTPTGTPTPGDTATPNPTDTPAP